MPSSLRLPTFVSLSAFLLLRFVYCADAYSIGVNYGALADNLPQPSAVANFLASKTTIDRVKLFDANPDMLRAFAGTNILLTITVPNSNIIPLVDPAAARSFVSSQILPFYPSTRIYRVAVGNEVMATSDKTLIAKTLPAMKSIRAALVAANITSIEVTTPHSLGILSASEPPSTGRFRRGYDKVILAPILQFHRDTASAFMVNPYPYFGYTAKTLDYALFKPNAGIFDAATGVNYTNMFDAQMDAVYTAMKRLGYGDVKIAVGETGWPSQGDGDRPELNPENAARYNGNLIRHVSSGKGTPLMPGRKFETYLFALFNEDLKPSTSERNFGLFRPDFTPVYDVGVSRDGQSASPAPASPAAPSTGVRKWCVPTPTATDQQLQSNLDYSCSRVDCRAIQKDGRCFEPNTLRSHTAYAMNAYYQAFGRNDYDCDFGKTGTIVTVDPSYQACTYPYAGQAVKLQEQKTVNGVLGESKKGPMCMWLGLLLVLGCLV
ncbi:hypothetical protein MLD38_003561 [Melastoma candidum]|uniref:Uncharacterized protein n=1 Tax=Melastoma candidum TaxID=119954 RepID=A0ACB9S7I4_9MYRT|nr:hypothetical protein MLD38_003561 [Melastoma candidum]